MQRKKVLALLLFFSFFLNAVALNNASASDNKYVVLDEHVSFVKQVRGHVNTVFEIRYDFDLANATVKLPLGCTLLFRGGSLYRGTLVGTGTLIEAPNCRIFGN